MADEAKVYLIGARPADPDLLTRKAERVLAHAAAIIYDGRIDLGLLALANPDAKFVPVSDGSDEETQADVCGWFMRLRDIGGDIVRVVAQDCLALDDSNDELAFLARHGFIVEVIPGVLPDTVYACRAATRGVSGTVG